MLPIWISEYRLVPRAPLNARAGTSPRRGALLRIDDGFADLFPWPELGDEPLEEQLALLARGNLTQLTRRSLAFAAIDRKARSENRSLFDGLLIPLSHWSGFNPPAGFDTIKIKGTPHLDAATLPSSGRLRIDFNATLAPGELEQMDLPAGRIDFIEDPTPYEPEVWKELHRRTGLRLALDRGTATEGVGLLIHKPAVQEWKEPPLPTVVTSYMDHPLGQFTAAWVAAMHANEIDPRAGLFTHVLYEPNAFSETIRSDGARLLPPAGAGFGFDALLEQLPWERLK